MWVQPEITQKLYVALWAAFLASCFFPYRLVGLALGKATLGRCGRQGRCGVGEGLCFPPGCLRPCRQWFLSKWLNLGETKPI